jgi:hypothetical protein
MKGRDGMASSQSDEWATPIPFVQRIAEIYGLTFVTDVCASEGMGIFSRSGRRGIEIDPEIDGLLCSWTQLLDEGVEYLSWSEVGDEAQGRGIGVGPRYSLFCNPPYSGTVQWLRKGSEMVRLRADGVVVFVVPARVDTGWWSMQVMPMGRLPDEWSVWFVQKRIAFLANGGERGDAAFFPSAVVVMAGVDVRLPVTGFVSLPQ